MSERSHVERYNYDAFIPANFEPLMRFDRSPPLGQPAPDFPLWTAPDETVRLNEIWSRHTYTIVEFGSFT